MGEKRTCFLGLAINYFLFFGVIKEIAIAAPKDLVSVVDTIDEFISEMEGVPPCPTDKFRPSLLLDVFDRQNVLDHFSALLKEVAE